MRSSLNTAEGTCTVYEVRPTPCRVHLNLDDDPMLCDLSAGIDISVPYFDPRQIKAMMLDAQPAACRADL